MPKKVSSFVLKEQPIHWGRTFLVGAMSAVFMMAFIDIFYLLGMTPFSFELYLGSLFRGAAYGPHSWTLGLLLNSLMGGVFGIFYAYFFEYVFSEANGRIGAWLGLLHSLLAAVAFFPFFNTIHEFIRTGLYPEFGFLGSLLGDVTPILVLTGHLLFGVSMGTFYGPVRADRVQSRYFEPGDSVYFGERGGIRSEDSPEDRIAV